MISIKLPPQVWAALGIVAVVAGIWGYGKWQRHLGAEEIRAEWNASIERGKTIVADLKEKANTVNTVVKTKVEYVDRIIKVQGEAREVIRKEFVPDNSGMLSGGFRLYHDAAATNTVPDRTRLPTAEAVSITDVTATIDANYQRCHEAYARVEGWQEWYAEQKKLHDAAAEEMKNARN